MTLESFSQILANGMLQSDSDLSMKTLLPVNSML